jgi:hypothetical protein
LLQLSLIGWLPAAIWAAYSLNQHNTDKKLAKMKAELQATKTT